MTTTGTRACWSQCLYSFISSISRAIILSCQTNEVVFQMVLFLYPMSATALDIRDAAANIKLLLYYPIDSAFIGP